MNAATIAAIAAALLKAVKLGPTVIQTVEDAKPFAEIIIGALKGKKLTAEQIAELEAKVDALSDEFQKPLPPEGDV